MAKEKLALISLGCAKNLVNSEQMLCLLDDAGYPLVSDPAQADGVIINTCGFIDDAKSEAIDTILEMARLREAGTLRKIIVTGCLPERYRAEIRSELPEVDAMVGVGSFADIVSVVEETFSQGASARFGDKNAPVDEVGRYLTTGPGWAYLKIAEGCSNCCSFCAIPAIRGRYRSRPMENILAEARALAEAGVKEMLVIAQDITRYGVDLYGEKRLPALLNALCDLDFQWIRLHYLYPDAITDELLDTIAAQPKICHYLDIPIQHCNDAVLKAMRRRETKAGLLDLFARIRRRIPDIVLRTSIITGLPFEDEAAFDELCAFLRQVRIQRVGAFPFSPEEGTPAADMPNRVDGDEAARRAELVMDVQSDVMDDFNESRLGTVVTVLCDGWDEEAQSFVGRSYAESPGIDGVIYFDAPVAHPGDMLPVRITGVMDGDLTGEVEG